MALWASCWNTGRRPRKSSIFCLVGLPVAQPLGQFLALGLEGGRLLNHTLELLHNVRPEHVPVAIDRCDGVDVQRVEAVKEINLLLRLLKLRVLRHRDAKELLPGAVAVPLALADRKLLLELLQAVGGLHGVQSRNHGPVGFPVVPEADGINHKELDLLDEVLFEAHLEAAEVLSDFSRQLHELFPAVSHVLDGVRLLLRHADFVAPEKSVHLLDRRDEIVDLGLLLTHLLQDAHHKAHVLEVLDLVVKLHCGLPDVLHKGLQVLLALGVQIFGKLGLPGRGLGLQRVLHRLGEKRKGADVVDGGDLGHFVLDVEVLLELTLEVLHGGFLLHEGVVLRLHVLFPQKAVLGEGVHVVQGLLFGTLNAARERKDGLHDLLVGGNKLMERRRPVGPTAPGIQVLGDQEDLLGSRIHHALDLVQARHEAHRRDCELHPDVEEGLLDEEEAAARLGTDPLLEVVQGLLHSAENGLIHELAVVRLQLLGFLLRERHLSVLPGEVRNELDEVVYGAGHLHVTHPHELPLALHLLRLQRNELFECEGAVGGKIHELDLAHRLEIPVNAVFNAVGHSLDELPQARQTTVDAVQVPVDVHRRPRQDEHPGLHLALEVVHMGLHEGAGDLGDGLHHLLVLTHGVGELVEVVLELLLLQEHHLGRVRDLHTYALQVLRFPH